MSLLFSLINPDVLNLRLVIMEIHPSSTLALRLQYATCSFSSSISYSLALISASLPSNSSWVLDKSLILASSSKVDTLAWWATFQIISQIIIKYLAKESIGAISSYFFMEGMDLWQWTYSFRLVACWSHLENWVLFYA